MTNEEIVKQIKNGVSVNNNMEQLYKQNLPFLKMVCKPFAAYEPLEDLLQESFISLYKAVEKYDCDSDVAFITYAKYWVKHYLHNYMNKCKDLCLPNYVVEMQYKYKDALKELQNRLLRNPTIAEIAEFLNVSITKVKNIRLTLLDCLSLDTPLNEDAETTIRDTVKDDFSIEENVIDKICYEQQKSELWGIVERYTSDIENEIIRDYFLKKRNVAEISRDYGVSYSKIRQLKQNGIRKLKTGKVKRQLMEKFEIIDCKTYNTGLSRFKNNMESSVEYVARRHMELEKLYG